VRIPKPSRESRPKKESRANGPRKRASMPTRIRRRRKGGTSWARREADRLCGLIVRSRGACEVCGRREFLQWAHVVSRRYISVRWDYENNSLCLCRNCHYLYTMRPLEWEHEVVKQFGSEVYQDLKRRALEPKTVDVRVILENLRVEASRLGLERLGQSCA
jgi:hypothetical protein